MNIASPQHVAVVGAGFTGTLAAVHLLRRLPPGSRVTLLDRSGRFGRGLAYGHAAPGHLLNVRAGNMSAFPDDPGHFVRWLEGRDQPVATLSGQVSDGFVPRQTYGAYLEDLLAAAGAGERGVVLETRSLAVGDVRVAGDGVALLAGDGEVRADAAVLCLGNFPPELPLPPGAAREAADSPRVIVDPWAPGALDGIGPDDPVLIVGTGLTMVDMVLSLEERGHTAAVTALSRRGLLPLPHEGGQPRRAAPDLDALPKTARGLLANLRAQVQAGTPWRQAVDDLRPVTQGLWQALPLAERRRFLRHLRAYWDVHRHRLAPQVHAVVQDALDSGRLRVQAGRILDMQADAGAVRLTLRPRGTEGERRLEGAWLINCSGPQSDFRHVRDPLARRLLDAGLAQPDTLRLGLDVTETCALVAADGAPSDRLYALGPPTKGAWWEIIAVPDLRGQCARFVEGLVGGRG